MAMNMTNWAKLKDRLLDDPEVRKEYVKIVYVKPTRKTRRIIKELCEELRPALESLSKK